jgi:hypothetical protein
MASGVPGSAFAPARGTLDGTHAFFTPALWFMLIGLLLYGLVYVAGEQLSYHYAKRNRFHVVKTAPRVPYDHVILGASHAAVFDYEDMNARLEEMTRKKILNLSVVGGGITVNRVMLDYFLTAHRTKNVIYVMDSFGFYARDWNEDRLKDTRLFVRAPFDPALVPILLRNAASLPVVLDFVTGFSKINNPDRFKPDVSEDEAVKFSKTYRPVKQIDTQRIEFLYPKQTDPQVLARYLSEFEAWVRNLQQRNIRLIVIKPPLPARVYAMLPNEAQFDNALKQVLVQNGIEYHDFSLVGNDDKYFFNTDHLNRNGVLNFFDAHLKAVLAQ